VGISVKSAAIACAVLLVAMPSRAQEDTTPPALVGFSFSPSSVDVTAGPANVKFTAHITDDLAGVGSWGVDFCPPSGNCTTVFGVPGLISGALLDGTFEAVITVRQFSEEGIYLLRRIFATDQVGNTSFLNPADADFPPSFEVISQPDTTAPTVDNGLISPVVVDVTSGAQTLTFTAHITDDLAGVGSWGVDFCPPSGNCTTVFGVPGLISGTLLDGTFEAVITVRQFSEEGIYLLRRIFATDQVGNTSFLNPADADFPPSFEVIAAPVVTEVHIDIKPGSFPNSINLGSQGTVPVAILSTPTFDARTVDPLSITLASATVALKGKGTPMASFQDVNQDGLLDLVVHVDTQALQLTVGDTVAILEGQTFDGRRIRGSDTVRVVQ